MIDTIYHICQEDSLLKTPLRLGGRWIGNFIFWLFHWFFQDVGV